MAFGEYHYDPIDGEYSFVGAFASKNQLGFFSSLGIYFAFACVFILRERGFWCLFGLLNAGLCLYALIASQSATSIIAVAATLAVMVVLGVMFLFAQRTRKALLLAALLLGLGLAVVGLNLGGLDVLLGAFGKDATLTGRTYLWAEGFAAAGQARCWASATRPIGSRVFRRPSGYGRNSTSAHAAAFISTTPISRCWWNSALPALTCFVFSSSALRPAI